MKYNIHPFVKWVGGKRQLVDRLKERMPLNYGSYYEPFVGGGALFMNVQNKNTIINDISRDLTTAYRVIKSHPEKLMFLLNNHEKEHEKSPSEYFYSVRAQDRAPDWEEQSDLKVAARFIYLNKACFNGMYRVNKKGYYNVSFGKKDKVRCYNKDNIMTLNEYLNNNTVRILNKDFEEVVSEMQEGDFVFFDPPYDLVKKEDFDTYIPGGFGEEGQRRLAKIARVLHDKGCYVMLTNHNTPLINELYSGFNIEVVNVRRAINSDATKRTGTEVIIRNYK